MTTTDHAGHSSWWVIPAAVVVGATAMFLAVAAPHWTKQPTVPRAITVRADGHVARAPVHRYHHKTPGRHHPRQPGATPTPTATVTVMSSPAASAPTVTVVTPKRQVVTATRESDDNGAGGSDHANGDSGGHHHDN